MRTERRPSRKRPSSVPAPVDGRSLTPVAVGALVGVAPTSGGALAGFWVELEACRPGVGGAVPADRRRSCSELVVFGGSRGSAEAAGWMVSAGYAFGHGLSYTEFEYVEANTDNASLTADGSIRLNVTLRNTGNRAGAEVIQVYRHTRSSATHQPEQELCGFAKVSLQSRP